MQRYFRGFYALVTAVIAVPVVTITILVLIGISGSLMNELVPVLSGIGGTDPSAVSDALGNGWVVMALGVLAIPGSVVLYLLLGGNLGSGSGRENQFEGRKGGF